MNIKDFVRERVLTFPVLVLFFIKLVKKSLCLGLNEFCKSIDLTSVTKQAFSKARKKLSYLAFIHLNKILVEEYYTDNAILTWKGFRLCAIDSSDFQLPQQEKLKSIFGTARNASGPSIAMATCSCAYDVLNKITISAKIAKYKTPERELAVKNIEEIDQLSHDKTKDLLLFDRGYPAFWFLYFLKMKKKNFAMRISFSSFKEVQEALNNKQEDTIIRLRINRDNHHQIKDVKEKLPSVDLATCYIDLRLIVVTLKTGEKEYLITNLLDDQYKKRDFIELYNLRWVIEENYKWIKSALELENFNGHSELAINQEFFCLVFVSNLTSLIIEEAQEELDKSETTKKHRYKINRRMAIALLRDKLLNGLFDRKENVEALCQESKEIIKANLCPVRPDRVYERRKSVARKYGCTTRRCL